MKKILFIFVILFLLCSCESHHSTQIVATTLPVYEFTSSLCHGTPLTVGRIVTENVSCLHDYSLQVSQMRMIESADLVVLSGGGLEEFLEDALLGANSVIDASQGLTLIEGTHHDHEHNHGHVHEEDPHIWLSPENAKTMAANICSGLAMQYPDHREHFKKNLAVLLADLDALQQYGEDQLSTLSCRELITFHDGFSYLAESFDLTILATVEEESGSEASAATLIRLIKLVEEHALPAVFTETNGATSAAEIITAQTGVRTYALDMAMASDSYFDAMYRNIDTLREALQ